MTTRPVVATRGALSFGLLWLVSWCARLARGHRCREAVTARIVNSYLAVRSLLYAGVILLINAAADLLTSGHVQVMMRGRTDFLFSRYRRRRLRPRLLRRSRPPHRHALLHRDRGAIGRAALPEPSQSLHAQARPPMRAHDCRYHGLAIRARRGGKPSRRC